MRVTGKEGTGERENTAADQPVDQDRDLFLSEGVQQKCDSTICSVLQSFRTTRCQDGGSGYKPSNWLHSRELRPGDGKSSVTIKELLQIPVD